MIDLHSHILPGIDDGPKTMKQSLDLARLYVQAGYRQVVATPHYMPGTTWMPAASVVKQQVLRINRAIAARGLPLQVLPGMEVAMDTQIPGLLDDDSLLTLAHSTCLLLEVPFQQLPLGWDGLIYEILARGYKVLLAHPERCAQLFHSPEIFDKIINMEIYIQCDWGSLLGYHGPMAQQVVKSLIQHRLLHCLATDSHDAKARNPACVRQAIAALGKIVGPQNITRIVFDNPARLLRSDDLKPVASLKKKPIRNKFRRFLPWPLR